MIRPVQSGTASSVWSKSFILPLSLAGFLETTGNVMQQSHAIRYTICFWKWRELVSVWYPVPWLNPLTCSLRPVILVLVRNCGCTFRLRLKIEPCGIIIKLESECSFDAKLNNHFYVRAPCVRPVYLGAASRKVGDDSVNVWYGMVYDHPNPLQNGAFRLDRKLVDSD